MDNCTLEFDFSAPQFDLQDPRIPERIRQKISIQDIPRYHLAADKGPCWIWRGALCQGYGIAWYWNKDCRAHRVFYILYVGEITYGLQLDHLCRNRSCCNPAHLEAVLPITNITRKNEATSRTHCRRGHEFTPENTLFHSTKGVRVCRACRDMRNAYHNGIQSQKKKAARG